MRKTILLSLLCCLVVLSAPATFIDSAHAQSITLPEVDKKSGMSLMEALSLRKSTRSIGAAPSEQDLSHMLWAAFGMNREDGKRTIPTAHNKQNVSVYVANADGVWIYDAEEHALHMILEEDLTSITKSPLALIYATESGPYADMHVGSMYQNVGLYCATANLANVVKGSGAKDIQEKIAQFLPSKYTVRIVHSVGAMK